MYITQMHTIQQFVPGLSVQTQACGNCKKDNSGCAKVTQRLFCITPWMSVHLNIGTFQVKLAKLYVIITVMLGCPLKTQAHYTNSSYWLAERPTM